MTLEPYFTSSNLVLRMINKRPYRRIVDPETVKYYVPGSTSPPKTGVTVIVRGEGYIETSIPLADLKGVKEIVYYPDRFLTTSKFEEYETKQL